jgi:hypothetical protein
MSKLNKESLKMIEKSISHKIRFLSDHRFVDIMAGTSDNDDEIEHLERVDDESHKTKAYIEYISFVELAIINSHLFDAYKTNTSYGIGVSDYGSVDGTSKISYGGSFDASSGWFFNSIMDTEDKTECIIQTKIHIDNRNAIICHLNITTKKSKTLTEFEELVKYVKKISFNNSEYKGKCVKVKLHDGYFNGIEIIDVSESVDNLILNETQEMFIQQFIKSLKRGNQLRYLLDGEPGCGKTSSIRYIIKNLIPQYTFIIPDFNTVDDLGSILEACEIFDFGVVIMDDIDLFLGSREHGSYTRLLGQFLAFFDGVKKRKISLLASTNDKKLVDKAAERPGRFNLTLDFSYLNDEQIDFISKLYIDEKLLTESVLDRFKQKIDSVKPRLTGAFISNFGQMLLEMSLDDEEWNEDKTKTLFEQVYKGFYNSQISNEKERIGFK